MNRATWILFSFAAACAPPTLMSHAAYHSAPHVDRPRLELVGTDDALAYDNLEQPYRLSEYNGAAACVVTEQRHEPKWLYQSAEHVKFRVYYSDSEQYRETMEEFTPFDATVIDSFGAENHRITTIRYCWEDPDGRLLEDGALAAAVFFRVSNRSYQEVMWRITAPREALASTSSQR